MKASPTHDPMQRIQPHESMMFSFTTHTKIGDGCVCNFLTSFFSWHVNRIAILIFCRYYLICTAGVSISNAQQALTLIIAKILKFLLYKRLPAAIRAGVGAFTGQNRNLITSEFRNHYAKCISFCKSCSEKTCFHAGIYAHAWRHVYYFYTASYQSFRSR